MLALIPESTDIVEATANHVRIHYDDHSAAIERVINAALQEVVNEVAKVKPLFKVSEILKVGGFNEGTKIMEIDEFDYIAVLEHFSEPGLMGVELDKERPEIVRVKVNEDRNKDGKWNDFLRDGYLRCMQLDEQSMNDARNRLYENFGIEVIKVVRTLYNSQKIRSGIGLFTEQHFNDWPEAYTKFAREIDKAWIKRAEVKFPNVLFEFVIENRKKSVDLSPALRCSNVRSCFLPEDCFSPKLAESVLNRGTILLVGQLDNMFRITFTETEVDYLNNTMSSKHKKLYIYLKYVAHLIDKQSVSHVPLFSSYTLKLVCMQHDIQCQRKDSIFLPCLNDVIFHYDNACHLSRLPSIFNKQHDIMRGSYNFNLYNDTRGRFLPCWRKIPELVSNAKSRREHMQDLENMVRECRESFDTMAPNRDFLEVLYSRKDWLIY